VHIPFQWYAAIIRILLHICVTYGWWIVYISYLKKSSFIIYSLVLLISFLSIFNKFEKKKRQLQREDTQMKRKTTRTTTPTWTVRSSNNQWCGCKYSKPFSFWEYQAKNVYWKFYKPWSRCILLLPICL
jgi:hypothetical protein